jgi:multidrug transporter EmrE-like cation transporter
MNVRTWGLLGLAVAVAALGNTVSTIWANQPNRLSPWLAAMVAISPVVFVTFGLVASRTGMAIAAGTVDLTLTLVTFAVGLVVFREWNRVSPAQYVGMALAVAGIALMLFFPRRAA